MISCPICPSTHSAIAFGSFFLVYELTVYAKYLFKVVLISASVTFNQFSTPLSAGTADASLTTYSSGELS